MQNIQHWPNDHWSLADVKQWIVAALPGTVQVGGPTQTYSAKLWGITAEFKCDEQPVIFKGCKLPLFAKRTATEALLSRCAPGRVPMLLAWKVLPNQETWTLYEVFSGPSVAETRDFENVLAMTRALAAIQTIVAQQPPTALEMLPQTPLHQIPAMLDFMIKRMRNSYLDAWLANDDLLNEFGLTSDVLEEVEIFRPRVMEWTEELIAEGWPLSIDHVDFNLSNAFVQPNGKILVLDWEEAGISLPFFSIDRLLYDADDFEDNPEDIRHDQGKLRLTPNQMAIRNTYIDAIPWHTRAQRERAFDLAICLAPIKTAYECEPFNDALGRENGFPEYAARCMGRALSFWRAMNE